MKTIAIITEEVLPSGALFYNWETVQNGQTVKLGSGYSTPTLALQDFEKQSRTAVLFFSTEPKYLKEKK